MMMPLDVLLWCTVVAYHDDVTCRLVMVYGGSIT
jgi:hypothetical protein